jgi:hypothetical protein
MEAVAQVAGAWAGLLTRLEMARENEAPGSSHADEDEVVDTIPPAETTPTSKALFDKLEAVLDAPKKRGRPPGSKNKPRAAE